MKTYALLLFFICLNPLTPFSQELQISDFKDLNIDREGKIFESSGKLIYQGKMSEFFNSSGLSISPGFYVISVGTNTYKWIKK